MPRKFTSGAVTICAPYIATVRAALVASDVAASRDYWLALAEQDDGSIVYFSIYYEDQHETRL
jgi:hypothetical protein